MTNNQTKPITVGDLKDQIGAPYPRPFLFCPHCMAEFSANAGDYFAARPDHVFTCCGEPMKLVTRKTVFTDVEP